MPNQYPATQANPAAMYMPTIPPAVASSPQHQPHMYHQNVNQQSIPPMQVIDMNLSYRYFANKVEFLIPRKPAFRFYGLKL